MGLVSTLKRWTLAQPPQWLTAFWGGGSSAGMVVNERTALGVSAVWACVRVISTTFASLPAKVYERDEEGGNREAREHPLWRALKSKPNPVQDSYTFWSMVVAHLALRGNSYVYPEFTRGGRNGMSLWPINASATEVKQTSSGLVYTFTLEDGRQETFAHDELIHLKLLTLDGVVGLNPVQYHKSTVGLALASAEYASKTFENGGFPRGLMTVPGNPTSEELNKLSARHEEVHASAQKSGKTMWIKAGFQFTPLSMSPHDMQYIDQAQFSVEDVARIYGVPQHMIGKLDRSTYNNIEVQSEEFRSVCLLPYLRCVESAFNSALFDPFDGGRYYMEMDEDVLLRTGLETKTNALSRSVTGGLMRVNEARRKLNLPPVEGGDELLVPLNTVPLSRLTAIYEGAREDDGPEDGERATRSAPPVSPWRVLAADALGRALRREQADVSAILKKHEGEERAAHVDVYYEENGSFRRFLGDVMRPIILAWFEAWSLDEVESDESQRAGWTAEFLVATAARHCERSRTELYAAEAPEAAVESWSLRAGPEADDELALLADYARGRTAAGESGR
ncbi:MAG: hypothetical protein GHCLOJNM_01579 [bacterium]|nr:hypothetical protein [bacterium]